MKTRILCLNVADTDGVFYTIASVPVATETEYETQLNAWRAQAARDRVKIVVTLCTCEQRLIYTNAT